MKKKAATSVRVYIDHDAGYSYVDPKATPDQVHKQVSGLPKVQLTDFDQCHQCALSNSGNNFKMLSMNL